MGDEKPQTHGTGRGKQKCRYCKSTSVAGLSAGNGLCPYHFLKMLWGPDWAAQQYPEHPEARAPRVQTPEVSDRDGKQDHDDG